ncbi:hypothetical protein F5Y16DRAFT_424869 [Xylariaceae sp. FL0255]|nr:hypothetical protein F5Y16DRAFT_424869 [Xylariaceae sp. FL0255]
MQFSTLVTTIASFTVATTRATALRRQEVRLGQYRIYGALGCFDDNLGFATVDQTDVGVCNSAVFTDEPNPIQSVNLEQMTAAADGCTFYLYTDTACSEGRRAMSVDVCNNVTITDTTDSWGSTQILCPSGAA